MVAIDDAWYPTKVVAVEKHASEDIALLQFEDFPDGERVSWLDVNGEKGFSTYDYSMFSYPCAVANEVKNHDLPEGYFQVRPDLVYFKGYVRRRMLFSPNPALSFFRGAVFYEVSEIAGACSSGSPLFSMQSGQISNVFAVYIGEETTNRKCGYAVSLETIVNWTPKILGRTIRDEAFETASAR